MLLREVTNEIRERVRRARRVTVLTGAGISAESGVPTFRGGGGSATWRGWDTDALSSVELLRQNPGLLWEWFEYRRSIIKPLKPNQAHIVLAAWEERFEDFTLITQNVDGLHQRAGSKQVFELHGNLWYGTCFVCGARVHLPDTPLRMLPPKCGCGALLRPDVLLFGERFPVGFFEGAAGAAAQADIFFVIGTSGVVYPAAQLPVLAKRAGACVIEVNPEMTELTSIADLTLLGKAGEVLPGFGY